MIFAEAFVKRHARLLLVAAIVALPNAGAASEGLTSIANAPVANVSVATASTTTDARSEPRTVRLQSKLLGESRTLHVSVPANYRIAKQRYPVVYLLDGHVRAFFDLTVAATNYDLLGDMHDFAIPAQIVVGIEQVDRGTDLARNGELFTRFIVEELIPYIDREYRTVPFRTLIGHSLGGRLALQTFCRAPDMFPAVVAISASLPDSVMTEVQGCMRRLFAARGERVRQLVLSAGDRETRLIGSTLRLQTFVRDSAPAWWRLQLVEGKGLGHTETPLATIPPAIRFIFDRTVWEMPSASADSMLSHLGDPVERVNAHVRALRARVGYRATPSAKWMEVTAQTLLSRVDLEGAAAAATRLIEVYPERITGYTILADVQVLRRDTAAARRSILDALQLLDRLEVFDEGQRDAQRASLRKSLSSISG